MAELVHKVLQDANNRSTTSTSLVEITEYTISWSALTTAGFANGDNVAIIVRLKSCTGNISTYARASLRVGSTFAGSTELPGCLADTESPTTSSTTFPPILFIDDYTLVTDDNIYLAMSTSNGTYAVNADDFSIVILNRDDLTSTNYQYAETTPSGNAAITPTDGAQLTLIAGDWLVFAMTQWLDDSTSAAKAMDIYVTGLGASLATDNFNGTEGTELAAYNSTWVQHGYSLTTAEIASSRIRHSANGRALYYYNTVPSSPDYSISADLYVASLHASEAAGVCGRINASASTFYQFIYEYGTTWRLYRVVAGTPISIASYAQVLTAGNTYAMKMEIIGNSISCYVDGVLRIHAADANIEPTAGFAGVRIGYTSGATPSDSTLYHLDNFEMVDSNARGYIRGEGEDTQDTDNHGSMTYLSLSGSKTTTVRYWTDTASTHDCIKTKLMGIRMDAFADFWGTASKNLLQPAAASTYYEYANNNTFSLGQSGNVLSFGFFSSACVNGSPRCNGRVTLGGSAWPDANINTYLLTSNGPAVGLVRTPCIDTGYASVSSGTKDYGWEYKEEGSLTNQRIYEQAAVVFSLELASAGVTVNLDGVAATGSAGSFGVTTGAIISITGTSATGEVGSFSIQAGAVVSLSGIAATALAGDFVVTGGALVNLSGVETIGQVGDFTIELGGGVTVNLSGVEITGYAGDFSVTGSAIVNLDGVSFTGSTGDFGITTGAIITINGVSATATAADITALGGAIASLVGVEITGSVGDIATSTGAMVTISGVSATAQAGVFTIAAGATVSITGVGATGQVGTITVSLESGIDIVIPGYRIYTVEQADRKYLVLQQDRTYAIERNNKYPIH